MTAAAKALAAVKNFGPISDRVYQIMTSDQTYNKIFEFEFGRAHHSVFNINYDEVFDHAKNEADISILDFVNEKVMSATQSEQTKAFKELSSNDSIASDDEVDRIINKLQKKAMSYYRATPEYEETLRASVHFTFQNTLLSALGKMYSNVFNLMFEDEFQKAFESVRDTI